MSSTTEASAGPESVAGEARRKDARSLEYWRRLRPNKAPASSAVPPWSAESDSRLLRDLADQGYCHLERVLVEERMASLARLVGAVRDAGWPPVFAFVYDDLWSLAFEPPVRHVAEVALGGPVYLVPHLAVHYISASGKARGWHPHLDGHERVSGRLTTWLPLTDATLANGCMYLVPRRGPLKKSLHRFAERQLTFEDSQRLLQNCRAVPAAAGSILCWGFDLLHWGSVRQESRAPRVSVAFEWIRRSEPPRENEVPLIDADRGLPPFDDRLRFISRGVRSYGGFDAALVPFTDLANELLTELG